MKSAFLPAVIILFFVSCVSTRQQGQAEAMPAADTLIVESLFNDRTSTISEENIRKILDGNFGLPASIRVAVVKLESTSSRRYYYRSEEGFMKAQQAYKDMFVNMFKSSSRISSVAVVPDILIPANPSFTVLREAAVRMQADVVVVYSVSSDLYSRYKMFAKPDIKAYATTQMLLLDVRTGLIPFSGIVTKDVLSQKNKDELDFSEASSRIQNEAVVATIEEMGGKLNKFLGPAK